MNEPEGTVRAPGSILDNIATAVMLLDPALRIQYLNSAAETLLSVSDRKACGHPLDEVAAFDGGLRERIVQVHRSAHPYTRREVGMVLAGGAQLMVDCTISPLYVGNRPQAVVVEMIRVDRHLRIAREEALMAQQAATRSLVRGLAHEVKNPLGGLRGAAQLLARELPDEELQEFTRVIIREADRLQNLMDRMLGPNSRPRLEAVNVHEVTEHVIRLLQAESGPRITVTTDYDPSIPPLLGDRDWLVQALLNIARNSSQALQGEGDIRVRTRILRQYTIGANVHRLVTQIQIIDNGPGVPPDMLESIFYPMITGRSEGTGLGLSIAQSLVSQLGGLIECNSRPGETVFDVLLPVERADD